MTKALLSRSIALLLGVTLLSSCSLFSPVKMPQQNAYVIKRLPRVIPARHKTHAVLLVTQPQANGIYNTTQMAYMKIPYQLDYYAKNQWAITPAQMLEDILVRSLQKRRFFAAVITPPTISHYDYVLNTELVDLYFDFMSRPTTLRLAMRAELIRIASSKIIASRYFCVTVPLPMNTPYGGVLAANEAAAALIGQMSWFVMQSTK